MQVLNVCIASLAVFAFCYFSPFDFIKNILFCSGYFFAYEYSIISRNYAIGLALLFLCVGIYTSYRGKYLLILSLLFFLLFQTNVYGLIIGLPIYCYIIWNLFKNHTANYKVIIISGLIILAGIVIEIFTMKPPADSAFSQWHLSFALYDCFHVLSTLFNSFFPLPELNPQFWSTNILNGIPQHVYLQASLALVIVVFATILFRKRINILLLFYAGTLGVLLFTYLKYFGGIRHHGHLYLLFIVCYWLYYSENGTGNEESNLHKWLNKYFVTGILVTQVAAALFANIIDIRYDFSYNKAAASYLKANSLDTLPILGDGDYSVSGIAGLLDKDIYFIRPKYWARYIILNTNWGDFIKFTENELVNGADSISVQKKSDVIVILSYPFGDKRLKNWTLLKIFKGSVLPAEDYWVYRVNYVPIDPTKLYSSGKFLLSKGYINESMKVLSRAIRFKTGNSDAYMNLANGYNNGLNAFDNASAYMDSALKYAPENDTVVYNKGACLFNRNDAKNALAFFKKTIQLNPRFADAYLSAAICCIAMHDKEHAISYLKTLLKFDSENADALRMTLQLHNKNYDALQTGSYIVLVPAYAWAYNNKAFSEYSSGHNNEAIYDFDKAIKLEPDFAMAYYNKGIIEFNSGNRNAGCADIQKAAGLGQQDAINFAAKNCR